MMERLKVVQPMNQLEITELTEPSYLPDGDGSSRTDHSFYTGWDLVNTRAWLPAGSHAVTGILTELFGQVL